MIFQNFGFNQYYPITTPATSSFNLVYDLDAANFSALPLVGGSIVTGNNQAIRPPVSSAFTYGTGSFTIEWWSYQTATNGVQGIWRNSTGDALNAIGYWTIQQPGGRITITIGNGTTSDVIQSDNVITTNTWNHFAFVRNDNLFTLYVNGVAQTQTLTSSIDLPAQLAFMQIGNAGGNYFGRVTNFRIVKGTAVYTANFIPTTQPLKAISGTSLLLLAESSSNYLTDQSPFAHTITNSGTTYSTLTPFTSVKDATGTYDITVTNSGSLAWNSANGGVFRKSSSGTSDMFYGGPDYSTASQPFTVFMAYKWDGGTSGRLLNANSSSPDFLMGLWGNSGTKMNIAFNGSFVGSNSDAADTAWHFIWMTNDGLNTTNSTKSYIATNTAPTGTFGTRTGSGGFNGLRLFGRFVNSTTSSEPVTGDVAFVKVYDGALTLDEIQALHATYKTRMGY